MLLLTISPIRQYLARSEVKVNIKASSVSYLANMDGSLADESSADKPTKKPFDKKKWRENKYSHKVKLEKWTENRNKAMQRKYFRMLKKETLGNGANAVPLGQKSTPKKSFKKTKEEFEKRKKQAERKQRIEEKQKRFKEKQEAIKLYKQEKNKKYKILSKKNKHGQPSMAGRMQLLYEKIKKSA